MQHSYRPTKAGIEIITVKIIYKNRTTGARTELTDTVKITVTSQNLIANSDRFEVGCSSYEIAGNLLSNDIGVSNTTHIKILKRPNYIKEFNLNDDGTFTYKTSSGVSNGEIIDTFEYQIYNNDSSDSATVTMVRNNYLSIKCNDIAIPLDPFSPSFRLEERVLYKEVVFEIKRHEWFNPNKIVKINPISSSPVNISSYEWKEGNTILSKNKEFVKTDFSDGVHIVTLTAKDNQSGRIFIVKITLNIEKDKEFNLSELNGLWKKDNFYYYFTGEGKYSTYEYKNSCYIKTLGYQFKKSGEGYQLYKNNELQGQYIATFEILGSQLKIKTNLNGESSIFLYKNNTDINTFTLNLCN